MEGHARPRRPTPEEIATFLRLEVHHHRPSAPWKILQLLIAGSKDHAFLDRAWIAPLLGLMPPKLRSRLAIRLLALSPHYWIYQWNNRYGPALRRGQILDHEAWRVATSRKAFCEQVLAPHLRWDMTVLDLGTGPGYLAGELSRRVAKVVACDVSRGVIACARALNDAANLTYVANAADGLQPIADASIDLAVSIAVFQHLTPEQSLAMFRELRRVLRPGGLGLCHLRLEDADDPRQWVIPDTVSWRGRRLQPRMVHFRADDLRSALEGLGFTDVALPAVREVAALEDDVQGDHLLRFRRPREADGPEAP